MISQGKFIKNTFTKLLEYNKFFLKIDSGAS